METTPQPTMQESTKEPSALTTRRGFIGRGAAAGLALTALGGGLAQAKMHGDHAAATAELFTGAVDKDGQYVLPPLPYDYDALEPHIDAETMKLHHDKHHAGYVRGLIGAEKALAEARESGDFSGVEHATQKAAFHGAGHFLHCVFWANMTPKTTQPSDELAKQVKADFGSHEGFEKLFWNTAKSVEGSGWGILAWSIPARKLVTLQARNHQHSTQWGNVPLLVVDVWEHAYYKKYSNLRGDYVSAFMKVVNWDDVSARYAAVREMLG